MTRWTRNAAFLQHFIKQLSVLCAVYIFCGSTEDRHTHLHQRLRQLDRRLTAKLYDCSVRMLQIYDIFHIFRCQRFKIQLICDIEVRADRLRVVVYDNCLIAFFCKRPGAVYGTEVKLDTLTDTDRAGTKHKHFLLSACLHRLIFTSEYGVIIRCFSRKFRCTRINHLIGSYDTVVVAHLFDLIFCLSGQTCNDVVREFDPFCLS